MPNEEESGGMRLGWTVDRRVNIGHLIGTIMLASAVFAWASRMETRVVTLEAATEHLAKTDAAQDATLNRTLGTLHDQFADVRTDLRIIRKSIEELNRSH